MNANTARQPLELTAEKAATYAYNWNADKPENAGKTPAALRKAARELLTDMIRKGAFVIVD